MSFPTIFRLLAASSLLISVSSFADDISPSTREKAAICMSCHGPNGNSTNGKYPSLAGQKTTYIYLQLKDFMQGRRSDPEMSAIAATIADKTEALELAMFFGSLPPFQRNTEAENTFKPDSTKVAAGKVIADRTICTMCHGDAFKGMGDVPRVQGQQLQYVMKQIKDFRDGRRTNDGGSMKGALGPLTDDEVENLVNYIASQ
ncbi:MAG: c-type cytochrome [Methylophilaceae bacterium]